MMERTAPDMSYNHNAYYNPETKNTQSSHGSKRQKTGLSSGIKLNIKQADGSYNTIADEGNQPGLISVFDQIEEL